MKKNIVKNFIEIMKNSLYELLLVALPLSTRINSKKENALLKGVGVEFLKHTKNILAFCTGPAPAARPN